MARSLSSWFSCSDCKTLIPVAAASFIFASQHQRQQQATATASEETRTSCPKVLVVGGGLTGSLVSSFLRARAPPGGIEIHVWERASYPSGRFGALVQHENGATADLGAQVLSLVDWKDPRALPGHNITNDVLKLAASVVEDLKTSNHLVQAPDDALCATEERLNWPGLWQHYWAPQGLSLIHI